MALYKNKLIEKLKKHYFRMFPKRFGTFWEKNRSLSHIDSDLRIITDKFINSDSYPLVSNYWHVLNIYSYQQLISVGLEHYSTTVAKIYYTFIDVNDELIEQTVKNICDQIIDVNVQLFKKHPNLSYKESIAYNTLLLLLYYNLQQTESFKNLTALGNDGYLGFGDPFLEIQGIKVTTDKINALLDYDKIKGSFDLEYTNTILEIGAGSGRTTEAINTLTKTQKYVVCDIPPAPYISYKRLKKAFPKKRITLLFDCDTQEKLEKEVSRNHISFIFPHQISYFSRCFFDLTIAIDCIHEMDKSTIKYYFDNINLISNNFYMTIWKTHEVPYSKTILTNTNRLDFEKGDYPIPNNWEQILKEDLVFPSNFLSLGYKIVNK